MDGTGISIASLFLILGISFVLFIILREVMCWYWKINEVVILLKGIDNKLSNTESNKANMDKATL